jgi:hypothetical protein
VTEETSPPTPMRPCDCMGPFTCVAMAAILLQPHTYTVHIMSLLADCHGLLHGAAAPHEAAATPFTWSHNDLERDNTDNDTRSEELLHVRQMLL